MSRKLPGETVTYSVAIQIVNLVSETIENIPSIVNVEVPRTYKVTFGPLLPGTRGPSELAFRVYDGSKQRLVLRNVLGFWSDDVKLKDENGEDLNPVSLLGNQRIPEAPF